MAANLDQVVLVASLAEPEFTPGLVDRVLAQAEHAGIPARAGAQQDRPRRRATRPTRSSATTRAPASTGHARARVHRAAAWRRCAQRCRGRRALFVGHSGVGKSTLLERARARTRAARRAR